FRCRRHRRHWREPCREPAQDSPGRTGPGDERAVAAAAEAVAHAGVRLPPSRGVPLLPMTETAKPAPQIWVDADACPVAVRDILFRAAERARVPVTLVANQW